MIQIEHLSVASNTDAKKSFSLRGPSWEFLDPTELSDQRIQDFSTHSKSHYCDHEILQLWGEVTTSNKTAWFPLPHHGAGYCLTGPPTPSFYLQAKSRGSQRWVLKAPWSRGSPDWPTLREFQEFNAHCGPEAWSVILDERFELC